LFHIIKKNKNNKRLLHDIFHIGPGISPRLPYQARQRTSLYRSTTRLETNIFESWTKATLLRIYFRNMSVQRSFLQYKSQCLEKVNIKYVIKRLWHEIFHIVPGINPRPISTLQLRCRESLYFPQYAYIIRYLINFLGMTDAVLTQ
jgi:hypothetical protein